jgi:DNA-binding NarL/FixJ family response regulator
MCEELRGLEGIVLNAKPMNENRINTRVTVERVVFGMRPSISVAVAAESLRKSGIEVAFEANAEAARKRAHGHTNTVIVFEVAPEVEGGLLTTAKLITATPDACVVLTAPATDDHLIDFADFIDAGIAFETDGPEALVKAILA